MRPPPPGWRPPPGFRPPPGWRPPPFPPNMAPGTTVPMSPAPAPPSPAVSVSSQSTSAPVPNAEEAVTTEAEEPILLPKKPKSPSASSAPPKDRKPNPENQIYIGNLPHSTQLATLRKAFEAISPILTIELKAPYAMIEFEKDHMAQEAVDVYDEGTFGGVQIRVERATESEA
jgi:RNA recognition motif-containing protein